MVLSSRQKDWSLRLELAGGAQALAERVFAVLEHSFSVHAFDKHSFDPSHLESLQPDLGLLINTTEEMAASMQSRLDLYEKARERATLAIGDSNVSMADLESKRHLVEARVTDCKAAAADALKKIRSLRLSISNSSFSYRVSNWGWNFAIDYRNHDTAELKSTEEHLKSLKAVIIGLLKEEYAVDKEVVALEQSKTKFQQTRKLYTAKVVTLSNAVVFCRQFEQVITIVEDNLDLPSEIERMIEILYESSDLELINGEVRRESLKEIVIHLAGDYDQFLEDEGLVKL